MRRPLVLTIVAWIFIASGICGAASMIAALWIEHRISLAVDVLGLWVGPGLLQWDPRYYRWAVRLLLLSMVLSVVAVLVIGFQPTPLPFRVFGRPVGSMPRIAVIGAVLTMLALSVWQYLVLRRADIQMLFKARETQADSNAPSV